VFLVITLYAIQQLVVSNNSKLLDVERARNEGLEKNAAEIDRLNKLVRDNASDLEKLRAAQFDGIAKALDLGKTASTSVLANQDLLSEQRQKLFEARAQAATYEAKLQAGIEQRKQLEEQNKTLSLQQYKAETIIGAADLILLYLGDPGPPGRDRTDIARRFLAGGSSDDVTRAPDGSTFYGAFRIPAKGVGELIEFIKRHESAIAERLLDAGGVDAASKGTSEFRAEWRSLSRDALFEDLQVKWIDEKMYLPLLASITKQLSRATAAQPFPADSRSLGLQATLWSVAVQEGPHTSLVRRAWTGLDLSAADDAALICAIFRERMNISNYRPDAGELEVKLLRARNRLEMREAIRMNSDQNSRSTSEDCEK
jgi:hypothetical protein